MEMFRLSVLNSIADIVVIIFVKCISVIYTITIYLNTYLHSGAHMHVPIVFPPHNGGESLGELYMETVQSRVIKI